MLESVLVACMVVNLSEEGNRCERNTASAANLYVGIIGVDLSIIYDEACFQPVTRRYSDVTAQASRFVQWWDQLIRLQPISSEASLSRGLLQTALS